MTEKITDPTALACKKKFLTFIKQLFTSYPPMTFERYRDADGNHTNWFPQRYEQSTTSMYQQWFICAVLNNLNFISLVYKHRDRDATKIFTEIINSVEFRNAINPYDCYGNSNMITRCVKLPLQIHDRVKINYNWDFDISTLLAYYNALFQHGNINSVSANIRICNKLNAIMNVNSDDIESSFGSETEYFIYDVGDKHAYGEDYISVTDIDNMYMIQVKSDSTIEFIYLVTECYDGMERDFKVLDPTATLSLLMKNIADVLE